MNSIEAVLARMRAGGAAPAVFWRGRVISYADFMGMVDAWVGRLRAEGVARGTVCALVSDHSPETAALFFALMSTGSIAVPFMREGKEALEPRLEIAGVETIIRVDADDRWTVEKRDGVAAAPLVASFRRAGSPGLIVFTSGSTGTPKGILHDAERVVRKFLDPRPGWRTVSFLSWDHFGGINTLISAFAYGGAAVCLRDRAPDTVCAAIEESRATLLPTTPTFLNLLIASGSHLRHDVSSIRMISYGTEIMNESTLRAVRSAFPNAVVKQTYGLSELGVLRSRSEADDSVWVRIGGAGFEVRILDDVLWIRSESNMVGYLNAPNPFDEDGWMCTGDEVEVRGDYMRILGRKSDLIFVGGEKVFPAEVEAVLLQDENVREATVHGESNSIFGQVVSARITLHRSEAIEEMTQRLRRLCVARLARFKVPVRFTVVTEEEQRSERFKKLRPVEPSEAKP